MTVQQGPLERQVINIDLKGGMNESDSPDLSTTVTTVENLLQDQTGTWVKRPGTGLIQSSDASGTGAYPQYPAKILQLVNGWGAIADGGRLLVKQGVLTSYRSRGYLMDFGVKEAYSIGSTGPSAQSTDESANVVSVASCATHDAFVALILDTAAGLPFFRMTISERSTGIQHSYNLHKVSWAGGVNSNGLAAKIVCVADRFFQVFTTSDVAGVSTNMECITIDTASVMPVSESSITPTTLVAGACELVDALGGTTYSYVLHENGATATDTVIAVNTLGAVVDTGTYVAGDKYRSMSLNETSGTVWLLIPNTVAANVFLTGVSSSSLATVTTAKYSPNVKASFVCADTVNNKLMLVRSETSALGAGNVPVIIVSTVASPGAAGVYVGGAYGWNTASFPFFSTVNSKFYMHVVKADVVSGTILGELGPSLVVDLSTFTPFQQNGTGLTIPYGSFRVAGVIESQFGLRKIGSGTSYISVPSFVPQLRYVLYDGYSCSMYVPTQTFRGTAAVSIYRMQILHRGSMGHCQFSGSTQIAHGGINSYDGSYMYECGIHDLPLASLTVNVGAGNLNGSYRYYVVFRHTDVNGASAFGRVYGPLTAVNVAGVNGKNTVTIQPHGVTSRDSGNANSSPIVEVYRTKSGGTQFYLVAAGWDVTVAGVPSYLLGVQNLAKNSTTGLLAFQDNTSDTTLGSNPVMYRQPGTTNAAADRYGPPGTRFVIQHKDRMFCTDAFGQRVFYSSFFVDGEQPWFNPAFSFFVHAGTGPITGLASMDGRLFVFKRDAIFAVDGDGPGEAGPTGNEFSPPQALAASYGCIDHRSIVVTPDGIMYRSTRGIELLSRSLKVDWVGRNVQTTVNANPVCNGACIDANDRVHFSLAASEPTAGFSSINGVELIYDRGLQAWSAHRYTGTDGVYGRALGCIGTVQDQGTSKVVIGFGYTGLSAMDNSLRTDSLGYWVPFKIETGWIKQGPQARQRVQDIMYLAKKAAGSNHAVKISLAYNYNPTYTQSFVFEPSVSGSQPIEEYNLQPQTQQVLSLRVKIEDQAPADTTTYPIGTAAGAEILSIAAEVAPKQGLPRLPSGQKA